MSAIASQHDRHHSFAGGVTVRAVRADADQIETELKEGSRVRVDPA